MRTHSLAREKDREGGRKGEREKERERTRERKGEIHTPREIVKKEIGREKETERKKGKR